MNRVSSQPSPGADAIRTRVLTDNTAQSVLNHLKALESNRARVRTRWIWELLQNARDTSANTAYSDVCLIASVEHTPEELIFQHNGARFSMDQVAHLIYHGSTKVEEEGTIGQYGSGFLTTHLLSPEIDVSGQLDDGNSFQFRLKREVGSVKELTASMNRAWDDFNRSLSDTSVSDEFTTRFRYPIDADANDAIFAVKYGLETLKKCAPFVIVFNREFSNIRIKTVGEIISYELAEQSQLSQEGLSEITVKENKDGKKKRMVYLLADNKKTAVATSLESQSDSQRCLPASNVPRLFKGFPLIDTENFSFPAVINSFRFTPTEDRDGVYLAQSDNDANIENQSVIEEACELLVLLLRFAAHSGWHNAFELASVPAISEYSWMDKAWIQRTLREHLIEKIRQTPAVLNEDAKAKTPADSRLPLAQATSIESLWDLWEGWQSGQEELPRRNEAIGWCDAVESWARVYEEDDPAALFNEVISGWSLASRVERESKEPSSDPIRHCLSRLKSALRLGTTGINWLDQTLGFLRDNEVGEALDECSIVPSQEGRLHYISDLHRDKGIDEELKDIADMLAWHIRSDLRDTRLTSLAKEVGAGDWDNEYIVGELIRRLQERALKNPDGSFAKASVCLFSWIVRQDESEWDHLRGYPVFTGVADSESMTVCYLPRNCHDNEQPLAPVDAWPKSLQQFSNLFPSTRILADAFIKAVPNPDTWRMLEVKSFVRTSIVITDSLHVNRFYPDNPLRDEVAHRTAKPVTVTDVVNRVEVLERVRDSRSRAWLFWRFLTEWLVRACLKRVRLGL